MYFEQPESWGGFKPRVKNGWAKVKVQVIDGYGKRYSKLFKLEIVDITYAKKFKEARIKLTPSHFQLK